MDETEAVDLYNELKDLHLIDPGRRSPLFFNELCKNCVIEANTKAGIVECNSYGLKFLKRSELLWIFLHEEGHLQHDNSEILKWHTATSPFFISVAWLTVIFVVLIEVFCYIFPKLYFLFILWWIIPVFCYLYHRKSYNRIYCLNEDSADDFAAEKLIQSYPTLHLMPSATMKSCFESRKECWINQYIICRWKNLLLNWIYGQRYRSFDERIRRIKEKYENNNPEVLTQWYFHYRSSLMKLRLNIKNIIRGNE